MKYPVAKPSRETRLAKGRSSIHRISGRAIVEMALWIVGIALIGLYLSAKTGLENQRSQGVTLFAEARAVAMASHRLEDLALPAHSLALENEQAGLHASIPAISADNFGNDNSLPIAVLRMPSVGLEVPVYSDVSELNLSRGAGWIEGTAGPNNSGNMAVAGHRDQFFRPLKDVQIGDILEIESLSGHGEFRVSSIVIVDPDDVTVLDDTLVPTVTLVTCYPFYFIGSAPQRYIVQATAVEKTGKVSISGAALTALQSGETQ